MVHPSFPSALALGAAVAAAASPPGGISNCSPVAFKVSATADNMVFTNPPDPQNATDIIAFMRLAFTGGVLFETHKVHGDFTINGVYCRPTNNKHRHPNTLQVLVHGVTYNSTFWSGLGFGDQYNWHVYANNEGYHTLAIDRLGHGHNSRAVDPINVIQTPMHVEVIHQVIAAIRSNSAGDGLDRAFSNIIYVFPPLSTCPFCIA